MDELNVGNQKVDGDPTKPRQTDGQISSRYLLKLVALCIVTLVIEISLFAYMPEGSWSIGQATFRIGGISNPMNPGRAVLPGNSVVWKGEVWVSVTNATQAIRGAKAMRGSSSRLVTIDLKTGKTCDTDFILDPPPLGLIVVDDTLWAVSESTTFHVENGQLIQRNPRRLLTDPTKPFIYQGRLAVIDKNSKETYTLFTWNQDGEWDEVGEIEAPVLAGANAWFKPELRVITSDEGYYLFFDDGGSIFFRQGIVLLSNDRPASAIFPENYTQPVALVDPQRTVAAARPRWKSVPAMRKPPDWTIAPFVLNWNDQWDVAVVDSKLILYLSRGRTPSVQCYRLQDSNIAQTKSAIPIQTTNFSVASGSPGYFVDTNLQLFALDQSGIAQQITSGLKLTDHMRYVRFFAAFFSRYLIVMSILGLGIWRLMKTCRFPEYRYGVRDVIQASILRRGIARGIDSIITVYPPLFWFAIVVQNELQSQNSVSPDGAFLFTVFSLFGIWVCGILILSYVQGRWGMTPGKWVCGIRTFRTTLRPCGLLRALTRELMIYVDSLLMLTWLPGVLSIAITKNWQRLGDLTADTVVVIDPGHRSWFK